MRQTEGINQTRKDKHLNWEERIQIETLQREGLFKAQIGKRLGRPERAIHSRSPDSTIIVAAEGDSLTVKSEVVVHNGVTYISGPMPADQFAATVQRAVMQQAIA